MKSKRKKLILFSLVAILLIIFGIRLLLKKQLADLNPSPINGKPYTFDHIPKSTSEYNTWNEYVNVVYRYKAKYPIIPQKLIDPEGGELYFRDGKYTLPEEKDNGENVDLLPSPPYGPGFHISMFDNSNRKTLKQFFQDSFSDKMDCDDKSGICYIENPFQGVTDGSFAEYKDDEKLPQLAYEFLTISNRQAVKVKPHLVFIGASNWYRIYIQFDPQTIMEISGEYESDLTRKILTSIDFF